MCRSEVEGERVGRASEDADVLVDARPAFSVAEEPPVPREGPRTRLPSGLDGHIAQLTCTLQ